MKPTHLCILTAFVALGFATAVAQDPPREQTELELSMKAMNKSLRTLKRQLADPAKKDENLGLVASIQRNIGQALKLEPAKTKEVAADEKAAYLGKYKTQMTELGETFGELEMAIKADKAEEAAKIFDKLKMEKEKGHKAFAPEPDK